MIPGRKPLILQPGATFVGFVLLALDEFEEPVDLAGCVPFAEVRVKPDDPLLLDLQPTLITPGPLPNPVTVTPGSALLTSTSHGLVPGMNIKFSGSLARPLRSNEHYIVLVSNFDDDHFEILSFHSAKFGGRH